MIYDYLVRNSNIALTHRPHVAWVQHLSGQGFANAEVHFHIRRRELIKPHKWAAEKSWPRDFRKAKYGRHSWLGAASTARSSWNVTAIVVVLSSTCAQAGNAASTYCERFVTEVIGSIGISGSCSTTFAKSSAILARSPSIAQVILHWRDSATLHHPTVPEIQCAGERNQWAAPVAFNRLNIRSAKRSRCQRARAKEKSNRSDLNASRGAPRGNSPAQLST